MIYELLHIHAVDFNQLGFPVFADYLDEPEVSFLCVFQPLVLFRYTGT